MDRLSEASRTGAALYLIEKAAKERMEKLELEAKERLVVIADELKDINPAHLYLSRSWGCTKSPTDKCIYNVKKDMRRDHCLFCSEPEDRG
jgi:hypothetical protein